ncbi:MAG: trigger factor [Patescibacteria group bacterium UBA2163]
MNITKTKKEGAEVVLSGTLASKDVEKFYDTALKAAVKEVELPGFRKGNVPEDRVVQEVGQNFLWKDAAERALKETLTDILKQEEVQPIAPLSLSIKDPEHGSDVAFEITAITPPTVEITGYEKIAQDALATLPEQEREKQLNDAKQAFRTQIRAINKMAKPEEVAEGDAKENEDKAEEPITDEEAKMIGFENGTAVEHFIEGEAEKSVADRAMQEKRGAVAEALIAAAQYDIPQVLTQEETRALLQAFKEDVKKQGLEWEDYLKRVNKTEEEVTTDLAPNAEKRIVLDLVFAHIVREEKLSLNEEDKKRQATFVKRLTDQGVDENRAQSYAAEQFLREKAWEFLSPTLIAPPDPMQEGEEASPEEKVEEKTDEPKSDTDTSSDDEKTSA